MTADRDLDLTPSPGAAPPGQRVRSQIVLEARSTLRNPEQLLLTLGIPLVLLVTLTLLPVLDLGGGSRVDVVTPGILALAVMSTAFTGQAIGTGFERRYGALKFLGSTPLTRRQLLLAKTGAVVVIEILQSALICVVAVALGWHPQGSLPAVVLLLLVGTAAFSAPGLALAGVARAEATLAIANGVYLLLLLGGGVVIPTERLPSAWAAIASFLPSGALADALRQVLVVGAPLPVSSVLVLVAWAVVGSVVAARTFKWE
ncbi:MAG: ABC transporter permease [Actinobacteria bacterium]|uniref:Unannotated protein n=1 Tax=freshwater metagenome TaxID=449393 RepID=A0A6J7L8A4_9ZZZZ|nr:ABC transporter permease [Actinomycetota bacterium]